MQSEIETHENPSKCLQLSRQLSKLGNPTSRRRGAAEAGCEFDAPRDRPVKQRMATPGPGLLPGDAFSGVQEIHAVSEIAYNS